METDLPDYHYEPLVPQARTIRLLEVLSSSSSELHCQLHEVFLEDDPKYVALSYCWGTDQAIHSMKLSYEDKKHARLQIRPSLYGFLRQFVKIHTVLSTRPKLWVDAVCINQNDIKERNAQVAMMRQIYQLCEQVFIWLGEGTSESDTGIDFIPQLVAAATALSGNTKYSSQTQKQGFEAIGLPKDRATEYTAFVQLFKRDWFSRVWIIQEAALNQEARIMCGSRSTSWDDFVTAFYLINTLIETMELRVSIPEPARYAEILVRVLGIIDARDSRILGYERDLLGTLLRGRPALASDVRDKVFGHLGLATNTGSGGLICEPNYNKDAWQVYTDLALDTIKYERRLDILGVPQGVGQSSVNLLPSWVPDWSTWTTTIMLNRRDRPASGLGNNETLIRNAAGDTCAEPQLSKDKSMLGLQGYVFDQVSEVGSTFNREYASPDLNVSSIKLYKQNVQVLLQWEEMVGAYSGKLYLPNEETTLAAYWQTITAGWQIDAHELSTSAFLKWNSYYRPGAIVRRLLGSYIATTSIYASFTVGLNICKQILLSPPKVDFDRPLGMASNRKFVQSKKGFMGLVPAETCVGDTIALFKGGGSPLILRPNGENWRLVGDSYVHGMMNAECFREGDCRTMWLV